jgi:hypothetical protein
LVSPSSILPNAKFFNLIVAAFMTFCLLPSARLKILAVIFQISPAHAASAAIFTLLAQLETFKIRTTQLFEKRR